MYVQQSKATLMRTSLFVSLLLGLLLPAAAFAASASDPAIGASAAADYSVEKVHIPRGETSCIPAFLYSPTRPLTQPPGLVVMVPALGQNALQQGLHSYAHAYAANSLAVLILSAPGSLATTSVDPKGRHFLLHCGSKQQQHFDITGSLYGARFRAAVISYVQLLAQQNRVDADRVAFWGTEWGAVAAVQAATEQQKAGLAAQALILQAPWLGGTRAWAWQRLTSAGWLLAAQSLGLALLDGLAALLRVPPAMRITVPLSGLLNSSSLLQLQQHELDAHQAALASDEAPAEGRRVGAAVLLELLLWGNPVAQLLPKLKVPVGYYAAAADSDTPVELYVANSKRAKYVGFHVFGGSRYALLAAGGTSAAGHDVIVDQTLLLVSLLGNVDLGVVPDVSTASQAELIAGQAADEGSQQQQQSAGGGVGGATDRLFPFQQPGGFHDVSQHCVAVEHPETAGLEVEAAQQQHASVLQISS